MKTRVILIGGFLGAGKTTLMRETARRLTERGTRVGLITNDQAAELVDTVILERAHNGVSEVSGSCFCCNFKGFTDAMGHAVRRHKADIVLAEPVGSCTDLSATLLQPLKYHFGEGYEAAPLTVLVDPGRLAAMLDGDTGGLHDSAAYILRKQLEEADFIAISKSDLLTAEALEALKQRASLEWPHARLFAISAARGDNMDRWLEAVLNGGRSGERIAEVDYEIYAQGEAVLGWLNAKYRFKSLTADWDVFAKALLEALSARFEARDAAVGHVKLLVEAEGRCVIGNLTGKKNTLSIREKAGAGSEAEMTINARVQMSPEALEKVVTEEIDLLCGKDILSEALAVSCLSPGRPNPTYRFNFVV